MRRAAARIGHAVDQRLDVVSCEVADHRSVSPGGTQQDVGPPDAERGQPEQDSAQCRQHRLGEALSLRIERRGFRLGIGLDAGSVVGSRMLDHAQVLKLGEQLGDLDGGGDPPHLDQRAASVRLVEAPEEVLLPHVGGQLIYPDRLLGCVQGREQVDGGLGEAAEECRLDHASRQQLRAELRQLVEGAVEQLQRVVEQALPLLDADQPSLVDPDQP